MLETYQQEVKRKRKAARIFWIIVFLCASFLYFFFQGYYPDVRVGFHRIFSESGSNNQTGSIELIRSFGIINVRSAPEDASILLGSGTYGNNEKRMSDYGDYTMTLSKPEFLTASLDFRLDREKPFFIEKLNLFPIPKYTQAPENIENIIAISETDIAIKTASGYVFSGSTKDGIFTYTGELTHLGGNYFQSGNTLLTWEQGALKKVAKSLENFIHTCTSINWQGYFLCEDTHSILTRGGKYLTGVLDTHGMLIFQSGTISLIENDVIVKKWTRTGSVESQKYFSVNHALYTEHSGSLIPVGIDDKIIETRLDSVNYITGIKDDLVLLGTQGEKSILIIRHSGDPIDREKRIILPEGIDIKTIKIGENAGNLILQSPKSILLVYRGSSNVQWIVEGNIIAYNPSGILWYKRDNVIWYASWEIEQ